MWCQECELTKLSSYCLWLTLFCRSTWAPLESRSGTTSLWPLPLAYTRAVKPFWGTQWDKTVLSQWWTWKDNWKVSTYHEVQTTWEVAGSFFSINSAGKSPENHKQECKIAGLVATASVIACSAKVVNAQYESCKRTVRSTWSIVRTASDGSCGGGLGMRLQVMHERSRICRFAHAKLVTLN